MVHTNRISKYGDFKKQFPGESEPFFLPSWTTFVLFTLMVNWELSVESNKGEIGTPRKSNSPKDDCFIRFSWPVCWVDCLYLRSSCHPWSYQLLHPSLIPPPLPTRTQRE
jgi:hypothetical protein